jgi:predicted CopG family antitoxin
MTNITLAIPEGLHTKMKKHSEIRWSEVVRQSIAKKVELLEVMDNIAAKSKLTKKDINILARKVNKAAFEELNKCA